MINCKDCLEEYSDHCVMYTGPSFDRFNIKTDEYYDKVIVDLLNELHNYVSKEVSLHCLYTGECDTCDSEVEIPKAVEVIIDKLCSLTSSDIKYEGSAYCIGESSISGGAVLLLGKSFSYNIQPVINGTSISYDLNEVGKNLPEGYRLSRVNTIVSGKPKLGKSIILESDKLTVGATVANDRFPVNLDIDIRYNTPTGDVKLVRSINIPSAVSGQHTAELSVQDFGSRDNGVHTLESFVDSVAAQVCANRTALESFNNLDLPGCDYLSYNSKKIHDIISYHSSVLCDILERLEALENMTFSIQEDDCGVTTYNGVSPQQAINTLASTCSALNNSIKGGSCGG